MLCIEHIHNGPKPALIIKIALESLQAMKPRTRVNLKPKTAVSKGCMYLSLMPPTSGVAFTCFVASVTAKSAKKSNRNSRIESCWQVGGFALVFYRSATCAKVAPLSKHR